MTTSLEKIQWKIPLAQGAAADPWDFFRAFGGWIPQSPEVFVDVADYRHVKDGARVALIGHYADFFYDDGDGETGLLYSAKMPLAGTDEERVAGTLDKALAGASRLEADPVFSGTLRFDRARLFFRVNDRALAPSVPQTFKKISPVLKAALAKAFPAQAAKIQFVENAKRPFTVRIDLGRA